MGFFDDEDDDLETALNEDAMCDHGCRIGEFCYECDEDEWDDADEAAC